MVSLKDKVSQVTSCIDLQKTDASIGMLEIGKSIENDYSSI